ncbi:hypothetical protein [Chitinophaga arvensicola]|uniref:Uncharacterized protein n=1 Tax=Chitinophaga arvensicola TaxID=29529 RepID=A0A1I0RS27_9BACT|nr:hypothetical protein [Chitinophaga arvensicola]SEW44123.1 hypothetical protein SAMN04488122_3298 [Chitinophaga arvensicola]
MAKEKNKPVSVRFDLKIMELLKEEQKIETPQQALNFLSNFWENNRPATTDFTADAKPAKKKPAAPAKKTEEGDAAAHPSGLSGIDLLIWKAEQREKNND